MFVHKHIAQLLATCLTIGFACSAFADPVEVFTESQLVSAINCYNCFDCDPPGGCPTEIIVPAMNAQNQPVVIDIHNTINLNCCHNGLTLTISGSLRWVGPAADGMKVIQINGGSNITIQGGGVLTSSYTPCAPGGPPGANHIAIGVRLLGTNLVTVQNLTASKLSSMIETSGAPNTNLLLLNLQANEMARYGFILFGRDVGVDIINCHVYQMCHEHGFRIYASNLNIENCSSYGNGSPKKALWLFEGENITVDGFTSIDQRMDIGPDHTCNGEGPDWGQRIKNATIRNVSVTSLDVELGVLGCYLENFTATTSAGITIGKIPSGNTSPRPMNRIHWRGLDTPALTVRTNVQTECMGLDLGCAGDVDESGAVNVDDLLLIINNWSLNCPAPWNPPPPCCKICAQSDKLRSELQSSGMPAVSEWARSALLSLPTNRNVSPVPGTGKLLSS